MGRLDGKVAVITGAGLGMGRQGAIIFSKEGAKVVVVDWDSESGEETVRMIKKAGNEAVFVKADVSKSEDVKKMINAAVDNYSKLDILYNNAGIAPIDPILESTEEKWEKVIGVNLKGVWLGMKYAIPEMLKSGGGSIINIGSVAADRGFPGLTSYTASK
jgi:NAD(P)-dependent dehydrogenase (short-subunit alcohol dehydrogenase family)